MQTPTIAHQTASKRVLMYLKGTMHVGLHFRPSTHHSLYCYTDADWTSDVDNRQVLCLFWRKSCIMVIEPKV